MPLQETLQFEIRLFPEKKQTIPYDYSDRTTRTTVDAAFSLSFHVTG